MLLKVKITTQYVFNRRKRSWNKNMWGSMSIVNVSVKIFSDPGIEIQS